MGERLPIRGYLLHITHYDPRWWEKKASEQAFDPDVALAAVTAMADAEMNLLVVDCADGLVYRSHPELARPYSVPMAEFEALVAQAAASGIEVVPKLNFSQSGLHHHNDWFRPHNRLFDSDEYWRLAFEVIDELIEAAAPSRFFHVGMDEDHWRSYDQYVAAIERLRVGLQARGLRTVIWNDSACLWPQAAIHRDKSLLAEERIPRDIVQVLWDYNGASIEILRRIRDGGFELWGAPGRSPEMVTAMRDAVKTVAGTGMLLTQWIPCVDANRDTILDFIRAAGPICSEVA